MADHPLRPANHRCLGRPLPYQLANGTQAHPGTVAFKKRPPFLFPAYPVLAHLSVCYSRCRGRLLTRYSPVRHSTRFPKKTFAFDLHVLSTPPAFVLSQDQTLQFDISCLSEDSFLQVVRARFCIRITKTCSLKSMTSRARLLCCYSVFKDRYFSPCNQEDAVRIPLCNRWVFLPNLSHPVNTFYFLPIVCSAVQFYVRRAISIYHF